MGQPQPENKSAIAERVMIGGDLSKLSPQERASYYLRVCESLGINPMTRPFEYIILNGKLTLYARKDCADQLRRRDAISIGKPDIQFVDDLIIVTVEAHTPDGRTDSDVGVVKKSDMRGDVCNALMKAITKAKRRVTLSICGLGWLDETEVETIPNAQRGSSPTTPAIEPPAPAHDDNPQQHAQLRAQIKDLAHSLKMALLNYEQDAASEAEAALRQARAVYARDDATEDDLRAVIARIEAML